MTFNNYLNAFNKTLSVSMFDYDDAPNYHLLHEQLTDDGETSPFAEAFSDMNPIDELRPAENTAQLWTRKSKTQAEQLKPFDATDFNVDPDLQGFNKKLGYLMPEAEEPKKHFDEHLYFSNLYGKALPKYARIKDPKSAPPRTPQGVDISSLTPQDEWDAKFAKNQPLQTGTTGDPMKPAGQNPIKPGSYADRQQFAKRMKMSGTDYYNFFGRINATTTN